MSINITSLLLVSYGVMHIFLGTRELKLLCDMN